MVLTFVEHDTKPCNSLEYPLAFGAPVTHERAVSRQEYVVFGKIQRSLRSVCAVKDPY